MPDEKTDAEKAAETAAAAEKATADATAAAAEKPKGKDGTEFDPERAQRALEAARESEKKAKAALKDANEKAAKWDAYEQEQLSAQEKAEQQAAKDREKAEAADAKLQKANLIAELADTKYGIVNARAAAKLIEDVEYNDEGEPTNLGTTEDEDSLISKFLTENDYLLGKPGKPKAPKTDAREGDSGTAPDLNAEELEAAKKYDLTPEEFAAYRGGGSLSDLQAAGLAQDK